METRAQEIAERIRSADELRRASEATLLMSLCDLAAEYHVTVDAVNEVLAERQIQLGAEGTPTVSEFIVLELAGLLRCSPSKAGTRLAEALNLKYRHHGLYVAVLAQSIDADRAIQAGWRCRGLAPRVADDVTTRWMRLQAGLGWTAAFNLLDRLVKQADVALAAERERRAREDRGVHLWGLLDGVMNLTGRLDVLDARHLDIACDQLADVLAAEFPDLTTSQRRAKALGLLAQPARALATLQRAAQPGLFTGSPDVAKDPDAAGPDSPNSPADEPSSGPRCTAGDLCGTIQVPLARLRPRVSVIAHIHCDAVGALDGVARVERAGQITTGLLAELLEGTDVRVTPVIDLPRLEPADGYVPSVGTRRAVLYAMDHELFPFSERSSRGLDLDHTIPFVPGVRGQTRMGNLAPLSRRVHRAKTARAWRVDQPTPGQLNWTSPLGYRYDVTLVGTRMRN